MPIGRFGYARRHERGHRRLGLFGDLDYESNVHILATVIFLEEGGFRWPRKPMAMRPLDEDAPAAAIAKDLRRRRAFLRTTLAWPAAERKLCRQQPPRRIAVEVRVDGSPLKIASMVPSRWARVGPAACASPLSAARDATGNHLRPLGSKKSP